ncbi:rod shape-determining protein RodA [Candidatus Comchoanobacter bicostacola]|uniref:Cell wall polymerase n=1 Tax=Candidatus Comchoanobacter bicostacola TaxID=2919598 RepID=A0ABY5DMW1_9GAMM|nr:rod shape-determining protein RodA [Candidatus Comchoanobacter bicostacola]UTC24952.1 rod shape-determining protein RodA [Candidatus Comchoanobacter bicostacola]
MSRIRSSRYDHIDPILIYLLLSAILFGFLSLYSADHQNWGLITKQLIRATPALIATAILFKLNKRTLQDLTPIIYTASIILLIMVLLLGYMTNGAQRWLNLGLFKFEPSELVKISLPLTLASIIAKDGLPLKNYSIIKSSLLIILPFILVLKQPDLGTALIIATIGGLCLFLSGLSRMIILSLCALLCISSPIIWSQMHDYQKQRVITLLNPEDDIQHHGYHTHQSKIAIGSGGMTGKGLLNGTQNQLGFVPEHKTDFVFSLICEELGFIGATFWLSLVLAIGVRAILLGYRQYCLFSKLCCISVGCNFMLNAWINMAMVTGIIPVVGIPLPLISYGGTSFVMTLLGFAIVLKLGNPDPRKQGAW